MCYSLSALIKIGRYHGVPCQVTLATLLPCTPLHIEKFTTARVAKSSLFSLGHSKLQSHICTYFWAKFSKKIKVNTGTQRHLQVSN